LVRQLVHKDSSAFWRCGAAHSSPEPACKIVDRGRSGDGASPEMAAKRAFSRRLIGIIIS
jgi:hypothetical protein